MGVQDSRSGVPCRHMVVWSRRRMTAEAAGEPVAIAGDHHAGIEDHRVADAGLRRRRSSTRPGPPCLERCRPACHGRTPGTACDPTAR